MNEINNFCCSICDWVGIVVVAVIVVAIVVVTFVAICNTFVFSHCTHCLSLLLLLLLATTHATNQQEKRKNGTQIIWANAPQQQQQPAEASAATRAAVKVTHLLWQPLWLPLPAATARKLQAALALVSSSYRCDCCVWQELCWITGYRVTLQFQFLVDFGFAFFIFLFDLFIFCCSFFAHFSLARWARTFLKHCVCVCVCHDECDRTEGEGRRAKGEWRQALTLTLTTAKHR